MDTSEAFGELTAKLGKGKPAFILAELNDLLTDCAGERFASLPAPSISDAHLANYVAAMVEFAVMVYIGVTINVPGAKPAGPFQPCSMPARKRRREK